MPKQTKQQQEKESASKSRYYIPPVVSVPASTGGMFVRPVADIPVIPEEPKTSLYGKTERELRAAVSLYHGRVAIGGLIQDTRPGAISRREADQANLECAERELDELLTRPDNVPRDGGEALAYYDEQQGIEPVYNWLLTRDFEQIEHVQVSAQRDDTRKETQGEFHSELSERVLDDLD